MKKPIVKEMNSIRDAWTDSERERRRRLADAMQFQLRQLVGLAALAESGSESEQTLEMANAC
jgi:hypothetical protein